MTTFSCLRITEIEGKIEQKIEIKSFSDLPQNEVLIKVYYSSLNYKDALSANGNKGVTRQYPHTPGIDAAGVVEKSLSTKFKEGDKVLVTGYDLGMNTWGGLSEYICVPANWVVAIPNTMSIKECMMLGTAGFTAALGIFKMLRNGQQPSMGEIIVTGATGGVGSLAINILSKLNFDVVAATGKESAFNFLMDIGAKRCVKREDILVAEEKPLVKPIWGGAFDSIGGKYLDSVIKSAKKEANIVVVGLASSPKMNISVLPFILNGVNILGVNSADIDYNTRLEIWQKLANEWKPNHLSFTTKEITLEETILYLNEMLKGNALGRVIVKIQAE